MLKKMFLIGLVVFVLAGIGFLGVMGLIVISDLAGSVPQAQAAIEEPVMAAATLPPIEAEPTKTYNRPTATPEADYRTWVVYRVTNTSVGDGLGLGTSVSLTYENNTGGTNQEEKLAGDGRCHAVIKREDGSPLCVHPWSQGYSIEAGDFLYVSAQKLDGYGRLTCEIILADAEGAKCLVQDKTGCDNFNVWKQSECGGEYCICSVSGLAQ